MGLMLDSTVLIDVERSGKNLDSLIDATIDRFGDMNLAFSVMSVGELLHGMWRANKEDRRARRERFIEEAIRRLEVVEITLPVMRVFGRVEAELREAGTLIATPDMLIGCSALYRSDEVLTRNMRDFERIPGLAVHEWD